MQGRSPAPSQLLSCYLSSYQANLNAKRTTRGGAFVESVPVIWKNSLDCELLFGLLNFGVLVKLKNSALNSKFALSVTGNRLNREMSRLYQVGPRRMFLPLLP